MPGRYGQSAAAPVASAPSSGRYGSAPAGGEAPIAETAAPPTEDSGINPWLVGGGLAAGAAALALTRNPGLAGKIGRGALDLRKMSMLSGLAPLKSALGNVGSSVYGSIERGSLEPLKEMFSPKTLEDAVATFKAGPSYTGSGPASGLSKWNLPGRVMGSMDTAAQNALVRAGYTPEEAGVAMLQGKLPPGLTKPLSNPVMEYLIPFRRTPFNQLLEGGKAIGQGLTGTTGQKAALATAVGTGAATGALAEDPKSIALGTAFSGRYGLPFALAAGAGRMLSSGSKAKGAEAIQGMSPVSDYSLAEGVLDPISDPARSLGLKPAAVPAFDYIRKLLGMD
jgi:hypothetical protein